ncbi:MAG: hypothetical protein ACRD22_10755, partial [Terriglobia bacterium]
MIGRREFLMTGIAGGALLAGARAATAEPRASDPNSRLARTPPMGWNSWIPFRLKVTEKLMREQAEALVKSGMKDAG